MGSFVFTWKHPASEVYVTGTFDNWSKSERLDLTGEFFSKNVLLPSASEKIYYKFVVDGNWVTDHTAPQENDDSGNLNNILTPDRIIKLAPEILGIMSGVTPYSTTASLVGAIPLERNKRCGSVSLPGTFPETPAPGDETTDPKTLTTKVSYESNSQYIKEDQTLPSPSLLLAQKSQQATGSTVIPSTSLIPDSGSQDNCPEAAIFANSVIQSAGPQSSTAALVAAIPKTLHKPMLQSNEDQADCATNDMQSKIVEPEKKADDDSITVQNKNAKISSDPPLVGIDLSHLHLQNPQESANFIKQSSPTPEGYPTLDRVNDNPREVESLSRLTEMAKDISNDMKEECNKAEGSSEANCINASEKDIESDVVPRDFCPANKFEVSTGVPTSTPEPFTASLPVSPHVVQPVSGSITEQTTRLSIPDDDAAASSSNSPTITDKTDKKKKRSSFFGKLKAKLTYKDKE